MEERQASGTGCDPPRYFGQSYWGVAVGSAGAAMAEEKKLAKASLDPCHSCVSVANET